MLKYYELAPHPGIFRATEIQSRPVPDGAAKFRLVHLKFGSDETLGFDVATFTPTNRSALPAPDAGNDFAPLAPSPGCG